MYKTEISVIWEKYLLSKGNQLKEKLLLHYLPLVRTVVGRMMISLPNYIEKEDLISNGVLGLINALEKFDPQKEVKFETYANLKIKGAVIDGLRKSDWMPRGLRDKSKKVELAIQDLEKQNGNIPTDLEIAEKLELGMEEYFKLLNDIKVVTLLSLDNQVRSGFGDSRNNFLKDKIKDPYSKNPDGRIERQELILILSKSLSRLKEQEQNLIALYYYEQLTLKEIGEVLELSESRVSQIHTKIILSLRNKIKEFLSS